LYIAIQTGSGSYPESWRKEIEKRDHTSLLLDLRTTKAFETARNSDGIMWHICKIHRLLPLKWVKLGEKIPFRMGI